MPNHITNFVKAPVHILLALLNNNGTPDFNQVIPCTLPYPDCVSGSNSLIMRKEFENLKHLTKDQRLEKFKEMTEGQKPFFNTVNGVTKLLELTDLYEQSFQNMLVTGFPDWYDWNIEHWGSKWGPYSTMVNLDESDPFIVFQTAWTSPHNVFLELSKKFPGEMISVAYADEDIGNNFAILGYIEGGFTRLEPHIFVSQKLKGIKTVFDFCVALVRLNHHFLNRVSTESSSHLEERFLLDEKKGAYFIEAWEEKFHHSDGSDRWFNNLEELHKTPLTSKVYKI